MILYYTTEKMIQKIPLLIHLLKNELKKNLQLSL